LSAVQSLARFAVSNTGREPGARPAAPRQVFDSQMNRLFKKLKDKQALSQAGSQQHPAANSQKLPGSFYSLMTTTLSSRGGLAEKHSQFAKQCRCS